MTTQSTRNHVFSFHRLLIMMFALIGIWWNVDLPEDVFFTVGTLIWVYAPRIVHLELYLLNKWRK